MDNVQNLRRADSLRPTIFLLSGGAFVQYDNVESLNPNISSLHKNVKLAHKLASVGYNVFWINYETVTNPLLEIIIKLLFIDGGEDCKATRGTESKTRLEYASIFAFRDFRVKLRETINKTSNRIDPDNVFVAGISAGGILSVYSAFLDKEEIPRLFQIEDCSGNINTLDNIDFTRSVIQDAYPMPPIKGIMSMSGGSLYDNIFDVTEHSKDIAVNFMHGTEDEVLNMDKGRISYKFLDAETSTYYLNTNDSTRYPYAYGSEYLYRTLSSKFNQVGFGKVEGGGHSVITIANNVQSIFKGGWDLIQTDMSISPPQIDMNIDINRRDIVFENIYNFMESVMGNPAYPAWTNHTYSVYPDLPLGKQNAPFSTIQLDAVGQEVPFYEMGVNVERMFYRALDENGQMPPEILEDMLVAEDITYRWPGGATANFYHYFEGASKGYGLLREEVDAQDHPMKCNNPAGSEFCMSFEQNTPRNYVFDLLDYADTYQERFHKKKKVLWLPNIFTFYLHNKSEIPLLNQLHTFEDVIQAKEQGIISEDFYKRIKDIVDVYDILRLHPSVHLEGIEYGNELFYHEPATGVKYNQVNNGLLWLLNEKEYTEKVQAHISLYKSIIQFCNRLLFSRGEKIPTAVPVPYINFLGGQPNMNKLWNSGVKDSILESVDGVIYHFYFKADSGPRIDPWIAENPNQQNNLRSIKRIADEFMNERIPKVMQQYDLFFGLTEKGKKVWMTEFNTDHIASTGYFSDWQNTFFHAATQFEAFIAFIETGIVKYAFPHLWVSHINDYDYGAYAAQTNLDGSYKKIKRTTYSTYSILGKLAQKNIRRINADIQNKDNLERMDFYTKIYLEPLERPDSKDLGNLIIAFTNKSGKPISLHPTQDFNLVSEYLGGLNLSDGFALYLDAPHIYSSNGRIIKHENIADDFEDIQLREVNSVNINEEFTLPEYSVGFLSFPINYKDSVITLNYLPKDSLGYIFGYSKQIIEKGQDGSEVRAVPLEHYVFDRWSDGRIDNPRTDINVTKDLNIQAIFSRLKDSFDLVYTSSVGGSLQGDSIQRVEKGLSGTLVEAVPLADYVFDSWSDGKTDNPRVDLNVQGNIAVQAIFKRLKDSFDLVYTSGVGGYLQGDSIQRVEKGLNGTLVEAIPLERYIFDNWSDGETDNPRADLNVQGNITVQAIFKHLKDSFDLVYTSSVGGSLQGDSIQRVEKGLNGTFVEAVPLEDYIFDRWSDGKVDNPRADLNIQGNITVQALFSIITKTTDNIFKYLKVFPNPIQDMVNIEWDNSQLVQYAVYLISGQKLVSGRLSEGLNKIYLKNIPSGSFLIKLVSEEESTVIHLIKY